MPLELPPWEERDFYLPPEEPEPLHKEIINPFCVNCATMTTRCWKKDFDGNPLCYHCGKYLARHGISRPLELAKKAEERRQLKRKRVEEEESEEPIKVKMFCEEKNPEFVNDITSQDFNSFVDGSTEEPNKVKMVCEEKNPEFVNLISTEDFNSVVDGSTEEPIEVNMVCEEENPEFVDVITSEDFNSFVDGTPDEPIKLKLVCEEKFPEFLNGITSEDFNSFVDGSPKKPIKVRIVGAEENREIVNDITSEAFNSFVDGSPNSQASTVVDMDVDESSSESSSEASTEEIDTDNNSGPSHIVNFCPPSPGTLEVLTGLEDDEDYLTKCLVCGDDAVLDEELWNEDEKQVACFGFMKIFAFRKNIRNHVFNAGYCETCAVVIKDLPVLLVAEDKHRLLKSRLYFEDLLNQNYEVQMSGQPDPDDFNEKFIGVSDIGTYAYLIKYIHVNAIPAYSIYELELPPPKKLPSIKYPPPTCTYSSNDCLSDVSPLCSDDFTSDEESVASVDENFKQTDSEFPKSCIENEGNCDLTDKCSTSTKKASRASEVARIMKNFFKKVPKNITFSMAPQSSTSVPVPPHRFVPEPKARPKSFQQSKPKTETQKRFFQTNSKDKENHDRDVPQNEVSEEDIKQIFKKLEKTGTSISYASSSD